MPFQQAGSAVSFKAGSAVSFKAGNVVSFKIGVDDGTRTRDGWNHNPGLYQLSYTHH
jgi:hypothetical protein